MSIGGVWVSLPLLKVYFVFMSFMSAVCQWFECIRTFRTMSRTKEEIWIALKVWGSTQAILDACLAFFLSFSRRKSVNACRSPFIVEPDWTVCDRMSACVWTDEIEITAAYVDAKWIELWVFDTHMHRKNVSKPTWNSYQSNIFNIRCHRPYNGIIIFFGCR